MIAEIIIKKIEGRLSPEEEVIFREWLSENDGNFLTYQRLRKLHKTNTPLPNIDDLNPEEAWKRILDARKVHHRKGSKFPTHILLRYAAIFIGLVGCFFLYRSFDGKSEIQVQPDANAITLDLGNGNIQVLTEEGISKIVDQKGNLLGKKVEGLVDYSRNGQNDHTGKKLKYNTLHVPNGKTFKVVLSDGTLVHLNAGSSLTYPVNFLKDNNRDVTLIGEGYFDVVKNGNSPFIVTSGGVDIRVLGTKFNVSSYPEDIRQSTVLVEGSVRLYETGSVYNENNSTLLSPGYKADWNPQDKKMSLERVSTELYTGWMEGKLTMKEMVFSNIIKRLQRHYNVDITSEYDELNSRVFTATFENESIQEVLETFRLETPFEYEINGNNILIRSE